MVNHHLNLPNPFQQRLSSTSDEHRIPGIGHNYPALGLLVGQVLPAYAVKVPRSRGLAARLRQRIKFLEPETGNCNWRRGTLTTLNNIFQTDKNVLSHGTLSF